MKLNQLPFATRHSILIKTIFIGLLIFILFIPLALVNDLVYERESRLQSVIYEINQSWGEAQTVVGPIVTVPYRTVWHDEKGKVYTQVNQAYFLPDALDISSELLPEIRWRGIFKVVVYRVNLAINGRFSRPDLSIWKIPPENIMWDDATLSMGLSDTRGIQDTLFLNWNNSKIEFLSGTANNNFIDKGLHVRLPNLAADTTNSYQFSFKTTLNGNESIAFTPVGKQNTVQVTSTWADPSFIGAFLPSTREISQEGFKANWKVSHLGRSYPQFWNSENQNAVHLNDSGFGVKLLLLADFYQKTERSIKYGILFILLTFTVFFLFEVFNPVRLHFLQYMMVGIALCIFYLLLLSIAEQFGFVIAYMIAMVATVVLITGYSMAILQSNKHALILGVLLILLYAYLYVLLHLQDYALLFGAIGLFLMLATVMYITRHIDWHTVNLQPADIELPDNKA